MISAISSTSQSTIARLESGQVLSYSPSAGILAFRQALAGYYRGMGLAVEDGDVLVTTGGSEALLFTLGSQPYGVELRFVHEMRKLGAFCRVPGLPPHFLGITSLRGEMLPIVDLCLLLGMGASALGGEAHLVVMGMEGPELAIVASGVECTAPMNLHELLEAPQASGDEARGLTRGVTAQGRVFLDGRGLLLDERLFVGRGGAPASRVEKRSPSQGS